jgi:hypothetical protein
MEMRHIGERPDASGGGFLLSARRGFWYTLLGSGISVTDRGHRGWKLAMAKDVAPSKVVLVTSRIPLGLDLSLSMLWSVQTRRTFQ